MTDSLVEKFCESVANFGGLLLLFAEQNQFPMITVCDFSISKVRKFLGKEESYLLSPKLSLQLLFLETQKIGSVLPVWPWSQNFLNSVTVLSSWLLLEAILLGVIHECQKKRRWWKTLRCQKNLRWLQAKTRQNELWLISPTLIEDYERLNLVMLPMPGHFIKLDSKTSEAQSGNSRLDALTGGRSCSLMENLALANARLATLMKKPVFWFPVMKTNQPYFRLLI